MNKGCLMNQNDSNDDNYPHDADNHYHDHYPHDADISTWDETVE